MYPTVEQQLRAIRRLIDEVAAEAGTGGISPDSAGALAAASRQMERLESSVAARLGFLVADTEITATLLGELAPLLPQALATSIGTELERARTRPPPMAESVAAEANRAVRALLSQVVCQLPETTVGDAGRARVRAHLQRRLDANPALNRIPRPFPLTASGS